MIGVGRIQGMMDAAPDRRYYWHVEDRSAWSRCVASMYMYSRYWTIADYEGWAKRGVRSQYDGFEKTGARGGCGILIHFKSHNQFQTARVFLFFSLIMDWSLVLLTSLAHANCSHFKSYMYLQQKWTIVALTRHHKKWAALLAVGSWMPPILIPLLPAHEPNSTNRRAV